MKHFTILAACLALAFSSSTLLKAGDNGGGYGGTYYAPSKQQLGYIFGYGGYSFGPEIDGRDNTNTVNFQFENDYTFGGGIGLLSDFLGGSRFEFEGLLTRNDLNSARLNGVSVPGSAGNLKIGGAAVNLLKTFYVGDRFIPYIGAGIGYGSIDIDYFLNGARVGATSDSKAIFQGIVGADIPIGDRLSMFGQYKAMNIGETDFGSIENDSFVISAIMAGLRWSF